MKLKDFKKILSQENDSDKANFDQIRIILPDGSILTIERDDLTGNFHLPKHVEQAPSFTALLESDDETIDTRIHHVENPLKVFEDEQNFITPKPSQTEPMEIQQARIFYENLARINQQSYEKVIQLMSQNEKNLDERLEKILKSVNRQVKEEPDTQADLSPLVGLLQNLIQKGGKTE